MQRTLPTLNFTTDILTLLDKSPLKNNLEHSTHEPTKWLGRALAQVWEDFENYLSKTAFVQNIENETLSIEQYQLYLRNIRQQVSQGARWITRAASSMENEYIILRNALIQHAAEEHRDYQLLEEDYKQAGGDLSLLYNNQMNIGSEALSAFIMYEASQPNPVGIFGATFIIEGLGTHKAGQWGRHIQNALQIDKSGMKFITYHSSADETHFNNLIKLFSSPLITPEIAIKIRKVAKVVARLYALQLDEMDNY